MTPDEIRLAKLYNIRPPIRSVGCRRCAETGYRGRIPVQEVFVMNTAIADRVTSGATYSDIYAAAVASGMRPLQQVGMERVRSGDTTLEEMERVLGLDADDGSDSDSAPQKPRDDVDDRYDPERARAGIDSAPRTATPAPPAEEPVRAASDPDGGADASRESETFGEPEPSTKVEPVVQGEAAEILAAIDVDAIDGLTAPSEEEEPERDSGQRPTPELREAEDSGEAADALIAAAAGLLDAGEPESPRTGPGHGLRSEPGTDAPGGTRDEARGDAPATDRTRDGKDHLLGMDEHAFDTSDDGPGMALGSMDHEAPILVVDDDPEDRLLVRTILQKHGFKVEEARDGNQALERIGSGNSHVLVVLDLEMPTLDGRQVLAALRSSVSTTALPVIVLTGSPDPEDEYRLMEEGADDYLRKPLDPPRFIARVKAALRRARMA